jgi:hypothetical protein
MLFEIVYAMGQPELGHILSSYRQPGEIGEGHHSYQEKPELGIPFYSIHKEKLGERWAHTNEPANVSDPHMMSVNCIHYNQIIYRMVPMVTVHLKPKIHYMLPVVSSSHYAPYVTFSPMSSLRVCYHH